MSEKKPKRHDWRGTSAMMTCAACHATKLRSGIPGDTRIRYIRPNGGKAVLTEPQCEGTHADT